MPTLEVCKKVSTTSVLSDFLIKPVTNDTLELFSIIVCVYSPPDLDGVPNLPEVSE